MEIIDYLQETKICENILVRCRRGPRRVGGSRGGDLEYELRIWIMNREENRGVDGYFIEIDQDV